MGRVRVNHIDLSSVEQRRMEYRRSYVLDHIHTRMHTHTHLHPSSIIISLFFRVCVFFFQIDVRHIQDFLKRLIKPQLKVLCSRLDPVLDTHHATFEEDCLNYEVEWTNKGKTGNVKLAAVGEACAHSVKRQRTVGSSAFSARFCICFGRFKVLGSWKLVWSVEIV